eukprot:COSAG05_NODE_120_length_17734_cov_79.637823_14_plen_290_part_00
MSLEDAEAQIKKYDEDGNGQIEFSEFLQVVIDMRQDADTAEQIEQSFKEIAGNRDTITEEQLRQLLDPEDVEYLITKMDANEDGGFDYKTFVKVAYGQQAASADYYAKQLGGLTPRADGGERAARRAATPEPARGRSQSPAAAQSARAATPPPVEPEPAPAVVPAPAAAENDDVVASDDDDLDLGDLEEILDDDQDPAPAQAAASAAAEEPTQAAAAAAQEEEFGGYTSMMYVTEEEEASEELDLDQIAALEEAGEIDGDTLCWTEGMEEWMALDDCRHLFDWPVEGAE